VKGKTLLPRQRQEEIHRLLSSRGYASVRELAKSISVSDMTVRRDLEALAEEGRIRRVYGGAQAQAQSASEQLYTERLNHNRAAKEHIAQTAQKLIADGDTIALDASTTAVFLARAIRHRDITVITNSLLITHELADGNVELIVPGGVFRRVAHSLVGALTESNLRDLHMDKAFFSAKGVSAEAGFTDSHLDEVAIKRALIHTSAEHIALADHSKFGCIALNTVAPLHEAHLLISDTPLPEDILGELQAAEVEVYVADA
jgi:DeoR/GlpR family transcriptional regulator of sugar metabolism